MTSKKTSRTLELRVGGAGDALDRFEAAWNRVAEGRRLPALDVLSIEDLPAMLRTLTPLRWVLLQELSGAGPLSIYSLSKALKRDYKNVHTDVTALAALGLIERRADGLAAVPWKAVRAELSLEG